MANIFQIKRRTSGAAGAPSSLENGELAYNEVGNALYYGMATGAVVPITPIAGEGNFATISTSQTISGDKAFSNVVALSTAVASTVVRTVSSDIVATTAYVQDVFSVLDGGYFDNVAGPTSSGYGKYFYSTSDTGWNTIGNWYTNSSHTAHAANLPLSSTDVVILGNVAPQVNLDANYWVQPKSIDAGTAGIVFTSNNYGNVTCSISGNATFNGNSTYNV